MTGLPNVLFVEDDDAVRRGIVRNLRRVARIFEASTVAGAIEIIDRVDLAGVIIDVHLPDGSGFDVVKHLRTRRPGTSVLVLSGEKSAVNDGYDHGVTVLSKPAENHQLVSFIRGAAVVQKSLEKAIDETIVLWTRRYSLTGAEVELLRAAIVRPTREAIVAMLGKSVETVKTQIASLKHKTDCRQIQDVAVRLMREALERVLASQAVAAR